jgi:hypothetical protein
MMSRPNHKCVAEKSQRGITLIALTLPTGVEQWTGSGLSVTLPDLTGTLGASADEASWAVTLYSSMFAVSVALTHRLSSILGIHTISSVTEMRAVSRALERCIDGFPAMDRA